MSDAPPRERRTGGTGAAILELLLLPNLGLNLFFVLGFLLLATQGRPLLVPSLLIVLAFVAARNAGHAFNQWADRRLDAANARTRNRPLVEGRLSGRTVLLLVAANIVLFFVAAALLRPVLVLLAVPALALVIGYSYTKRLTPWTTVILGAVESLVPAGVYLAVTGTLPVAAWLGIAALVFFGTAFEIVHSLQDVEVDRAQGLHSLPVTLGPARAVTLQAGCLAGAIVFLAGVGSVVLGPSLPYVVGLAGIGLVALLEVRGLSSRSWSLLRAFRSHYLMGGLFFAATLLAYVFPLGR